MKFRAPIAYCLVFCLVPVAIGQDRPTATTTADALFQQAVQHERGEGGRKDVPAAARLYEQAARQGHTPSMVRLGFLRAYGDGGVPRDLPGAFGLFKQAAEAGDSYGQFLLALAYYGENATAQDLALARKWFLQAATAGNQQAQLALGIMLANGEGGERKEFAARRWLDKAASGLDRTTAEKAADIRDKIDKRILSPDNSGAILLGVLAAFIVVGILSSSNSQSSGASGNTESFLDKTTRCRNDANIGGPGNPYWTLAFNLCMGR